MKIRNIDLGEKPLFLAPMEDVTDIGFRMLCKRFGAAMVYTEFVSAEALVRNIKSTINKLSIADSERPVGIPGLPYSGAHRVPPPRLRLSHGARRRRPALRAGDHRPHGSVDALRPGGQPLARDCPHASAHERPDHPGSGPSRQVMR